MLLDARIAGVRGQDEWSRDRRKENIGVMLQAGYNFFVQLTLDS